MRLKDCACGNERKTTVMDFIEIKGISVFAHHGVLPEETKEGQNFYIDARLYLNLEKAGTSDALEATVDYGEVSLFINTFLTTNTYKLLEAAAQNLATELLKKFDGIDMVDITIHKPDAPIPVAFDDVTVNITRKWNTAYLGIGSNMGDKQRFVDNALCKLKQLENVKNVKCSKLLVTEPYGGVEQDKFLNGAVEIKTLYTPEQLLEELHRIENEAGRERTIHWGPRTLDLDILFYEDIVMSTDTLIIPHPDMENRIFVLEPLMELCPHYVNQATGKSVKMMYSELTKRA